MRVQVPAQSSVDSTGWLVLEVLAKGAREMYLMGEGWGEGAQWGQECRKGGKT